MLALSCLGLVSPTVSSSDLVRGSISPQSITLVEDADRAAIRTTADRIRGIMGPRDKPEDGTLVMAPSCHLTGGTYREHPRC